MYPNYPNQQMPGYPPQPNQQMPGQQMPPSYPGQQQQMPPGYPGMQGFPPQQQGYPQDQQYGMPPAAYPPQQSPYGQGAPAYPPQQGQQYPGQQQQAFGGGYPPMTGQQPQYGQGAPAYPPQQQMPPGGNFQQPMMQQQFSSYTNAAPPQQQQAAGYGQQVQKPRGRPTVVPAPNFDACNDAAALRKAMKGFGTDEDALIEVLCRRTNAQRMEIVRAFKTAYGKDLISEIKSECRNNFLSVLTALLTPMLEFYAIELYEAMHGEGTDEDVLVEVMCALSNYEIRCIGATYGRLYGKTLEDELRSDTSGCFKRIMVSLSCGGRDESMITDVDKAKTDAQSLKTAGISRMGTDESEFNRILCLRNTEQIKLIAQEYQNLTGHTLEKDIKKEFSGDVEDAMVAILRCALNRNEFFARRLKKAMEGLGTNDRDLIRLIVTRCEVDMVDIKEEFAKKYGKTLKSFVKGDTSGDYKHALFALIGESRN